MLYFLLNQLFYVPVKYSVLNNNKHPCRLFKEKFLMSLSLWNKVPFYSFLYKAVRCRAMFSPVAQWMNTAANSGDTGDVGSIFGLGKSSGDGNGHSSILDWIIPWTEEPHKLQSLRLNQTQPSTHIHIAHLEYVFLQSQQEKIKNKSILR